MTSVASDTKRRIRKSLGEGAPGFDHGSGTPCGCRPNRCIGREVATADNLDARINLAADAEEIRVFDVDGDGLVDVVRTSGTSLQVWFALGRYPKGDGLFGSATWPCTLLRRGVWGCASRVVRI